MRFSRLGLGHLQLGADGAHQAYVLGEPEHAIYRVLLTSAHQLLAAEARVRTQDNLHVVEVFIPRRHPKHPLPD